MPPVVFWLARRTLLGDSAWKPRDEVNRLTAGDFSLRQVGACWLRLFLEGSI